jgi:hypothetical protein
VVTPADAEHVVVLKLPILGVVDREDGRLADFDVGHLLLHQLVGPHQPIDGFHLRLVGRHQDLLEGAQHDHLGPRLQRVHLHVVEDAVAAVEETVAFEFDPEVIFDGEDEDVAFDVRQNELIFGAEEDLHDLGFGGHFLFDFLEGGEVPEGDESILLSADQVAAFAGDGDGRDLAVLAVVGSAEDLLAPVADLEEHHVAEGGAQCEVVGAVGGDDRGDAHPCGTVVEGGRHVL